MSWPPVLPSLPTSQEAPETYVPLALLTEHCGPPAEAGGAYMEDAIAQGHEPLGSGKGRSLWEGLTGKGSRRMGSEAKRNLAADPSPLLGPPTCRAPCSATLPLLLSRWQDCPGTGGDPAVCMKSHHHIPWGWLAGGLWGHCPLVKALMRVNKEVIMHLV